MKFGANYNPNGKTEVTYKPQFDTNLTLKNITIAISVILILLLTFVCGVYTAKDVLILHLIALLKGFNNFLFLEKGIDNIDIEKLKKATQYKKGIVKIALKGNITEEDITEILKLLINNYSQYGVYYEYLDENTIQRLKVKYYNKKYPTTPKEIIKLYL